MLAERKCCEVFVYELETFHCWRPNSISHCDIGEQKPPKTSPSPCTAWTPSAMPWPTSRTTPYRRSNGWGTAAHRCRKVPLGYNGTPQMGPQKYPFPWTNGQYLPHPWNRSNYDAKRHPDLIRCFSTMHWTGRPTHVYTDRPTDRPRESLTSIGRCDPRATWPNNNNNDKVYR